MSDIIINGLRRNGRVGYLQRRRLLEGNAIRTADARLASAVYHLAKEGLCEEEIERDAHGLVLLTPRQLEALGNPQEAEDGPEEEE